jgi:hypothetical protein
VRFSNENTTTDGYSFGGVPGLPQTFAFARAVVDGAVDTGAVVVGAEEEDEDDPHAAQPIRTARIATTRTA